MYSKLKSGVAALILPASVAISNVAHAALPAGVETAVTTAQTDGVTLVGALAVAGAAIFIIAKVLRKFGVFL